MKNKLIISLFAFATLLGLTSCGSETPTPSTTEVPTTEAPTPTTTVEPTTTNNDNYSVTVVYPNGTGVKGCKIQWCTMDGNCYMPRTTNEDGFASITLDESDYYVHIIGGMPEGYTYNPNIYTATNTNTNFEIKLIEINTATDGEGTKTSPYQLALGTYSQSFTATREMVYYAFTPTTSGNYTIESIVYTTSADGVIDPILYYYGTDSSFAKYDTTDKDSGYDKNFKISRNLEANTTYYFFMYLSTDTTVDLTEVNTVNFIITLN